MRTKFIPGYNNFYKVGDDGRVWSCRTIGKPRDKKGPWKEIKGTPNKARRGHLLVGLVKNGRTKMTYIHLLVLHSFVGPCPEGMECRHLDGNPINNKLDNLEWNTFKVNQMDRDKHGTRNTLRGEYVGTSKLSYQKAITIRKLYKNGGWTMKQLAKTYNMSVTPIFKVIHRHTWRHI